MDFSGGAGRNEMLAPHWLDGVIESAIKTEDPAKIAEAIGKSRQLRDAIMRGLGNRPDEGVPGASHAQIIRLEIQNLVVPPEQE
jgi:hypothetical protein